jgi:hypothetical protein
VKRFFLVLAAVLSVGAVVWKLVSDWKKENAEKAKRNEILQKAREAKEQKAIERSLENSETE